MKLALKLFGFAALIIAAIDLLAGNTGKSILPDFLGNALTQQRDLVLAAVGAGSLYLAFK